MLFPDYKYVFISISYAKIIKHIKQKKVVITTITTLFYFTKRDYNALISVNTLLVVRTAAALFSNNAFSSAFSL